MTRLTIEDEPPGLIAVPRDRECVVCFVDRMVHAYGCSGRLTWAALWRDRRAPAARALERRLGRKGGYCDCEVLVNAFVRPELVLARIAGAWTAEDEALEKELSQRPPDCSGVRLGSSQSCDRWVARRRGTW